MPTTAREKRTVVVTGASSGLGTEAAKTFAERGDRVVVVGRNPDRTRAVAEAIGAEWLLADYDRLDDVRALGAALLERCDAIHLLANNAGGMARANELTDDGHERTYQANLLAPFLLTELLLPRLIETAAAEAAKGEDAGPRHPVRIVATASNANNLGSLRLDDLDWQRRRWLGGWPAYGTAKLGVILWIKGLAERTTGTGVDAYSFHPGVVRTSFGSESPFIAWAFRNVGPLFMIDAKAGAGPLIALGSDLPVGAPSGSYFDRFTVGGRTATQAKDPLLARELQLRLASDADVELVH